MPELPEVQGYKTYIDSTSLHHTIESMDCRDDRLLKKDIRTFKKHLVGVQLSGTRRIGKYSFVETTGDKILVMHFGMTGKPTYYKDADARPKFGHIVLSFENGFQLVFENKRKFGWWDLIDDIEAYKKEHDLSDDARELSLDDFKKSLSSRKTDIKKVIMDQSVAAGIGNWLADEVLYQAKIHPQLKVADMSEERIEHLHKTMQEVIEVTIEHDAHYSDFPDHYLMHIREEGADCHHTSSKIKKIKVGGRATYFSPQWQEK
ncbi:Fpg/Nei family DNA glycosylase [Nonlabens ponticola]|uniref:Fpg/Nei family DNA glycosylase n=1 Tax=Nonlabens ponticola TaxID=2496866 RepID=A0A3S9MY78_9FLAO|nr:DNA-formamidopyrimidine glycosylase family protein [Nonlabens ponticola]AZQ44092.1 Fpg/Nei family DNA glycosylase [Nonlabens ponticola]